jgi:putative oxidoreductase
MILVIQIVAYPNAFNDHLAWGSIVLLLLTRGPGAFSIDHPIERLVRSRRCRGLPPSRSRTATA